MNKLLLLATSTAVLSTAAYAKTGVALGVNIGTQGYAVESRACVMDNLYGRLGINAFSRSKRLEDGIVHYTGKVKILTVPVILDFHPVTNSGFRLSAGLAYNNNHLEASSTPAQNITLDGRSYTPAQMGKITSRLSVGNKVAPILSIGYDSSCMNDNNWSFNAELGAMYAGKSKVKVTATGAFGQQTQMLNDLNSDAKKGLDEVQKYLKWYPIVSIGVKYSF